MSSQIRPKNFQGKQSVELQMERDFEQICNTLSEHTNQPVKTLTIKEFYSLLETYKKKNKH